MPKDPGERPSDDYVYDQRSNPLFESNSDGFLPGVSYNCIRAEYTVPLRDFQAHIIE